MGKRREQAVELDSKNVKETSKEIAEYPMRLSTYLSVNRALHDWI